MENTAFKINEEDVLGVMDYNKVDAVLVTSGGAVYLTSAKNVCASECARHQHQWREVTREELGSEPPVVSLGTQNNDVPLENLKVDELKELAANEGIELTATKKADIIAEIRAKQGTQLVGPEGDGNSTNAETTALEGDDNSANAGPATSEDEQANVTDETPGATATNPAE